MSQEDIISSLTKGDMIEITYTSMDLYNAGSEQSHIGEVVDIVPNDSDEDTSANQIIYKMNNGEVFLFDEQVGHIYVHKTEDRRTLKGKGATVSIIEEDS